MSNPAPLLRPDQTAEALAYRPVSGFAIAGLLLAVGYAVVLGVMAVVAITHNDLLIAPVWTYIVALGAIALALVAGVQIRASEGTRTGAGLARAGLWIAVLPLLAYLAYSYGNYLAVVRVQAERFSRTWFDDLRKGDVKEAFLLTRRPRDRAGARNDPREFDVRYVWRDGEKKGAFTRFAEHDVIRSISEGGSAVKVESLGIKDWDYTQNAYDVHQSFRIQTPEAKCDVTVALRGVKEGNRRMWQVVWADIDPLPISDVKPTKLGFGVKMWQKSAEKFAQAWVKRHHTGDLVGCYLLTKPLDERVSLVDAYCGRQASLAMALPTGSALVPVNPLLLTNRAVIARLFRPSTDYDDFLAGKIIAWDPKTFQADEAGKAAIGPTARRLFADSAHLALLVPKNATVFPRYVGSDGIQMDVDVNIGIREQIGDEDALPTYRCNGVLTMESIGVPIDEANQPRWRIVGVKLIAGTAPDVPAHRARLPHAVHGPKPREAPPLPTR